MFWNSELQGQDNALLASNLKGHIYFPAGLCTTIAKLESNSAPEGSDLYLGAAAECLVGEEKESGNNIKPNSLQNANDSQEYTAGFGHTAETTGQMRVVNIHDAISV